MTTEIDSGPIIAQAAVPVMPGDTPLTLAARVNAAELRLFPAALEQVAAGHVRLENRRVVARNGDIVDPLPGCSRRHRRKSLRNLEPTQSNTLVSAAFVEF